jgi:uncharacterized cysteine cluster protein YcgN (CxxCxxCC family)
MSDRSESPPGDQRFWEHRHYTEFSSEQWEALCDGCARCCVFRFEDEVTGQLTPTNVCCDLLDSDSCRCTDYQNRAVRQPLCLTLTPQTLPQRLRWLPTSCAYRRIAEGRGLDWWHPLVSGTRQTVTDAGISVSGRVLHERDADALEQHIVTEDWLD